MMFVGPNMLMAMQHIKHLLGGSTDPQKSRRPLFYFNTNLCLHSNKRLHRLVVRTSRCGRDNPGSNPGEDIFPSLQLLCSDKD